MIRYAAATLIAIGLLATPPSTSAQQLLINEVDADQVGTDAAEFVELYDGGAGNTDLTGYVLVLFNGSDDASYRAYDLDGYTTDANGYFVLCGDAANVPNCTWDVDPPTDLIQNGADAVALLRDDAANYPEDTPVTTSNLVDAIVYDTDDSDDPGLLVLLNAGQPQVNERGGGDGTGHSMQRIPNGSGGARNTDTYGWAGPTPGATNVVSGVANEVDTVLPTAVRLDQNYPNPFNPATSISFRLADSRQVRLMVSDLLGRRVSVLVDGVRPAGEHEVRFDAARLPSGVYLYRLEAGSVVRTRQMVLLK